jgi:aspartyl-tRNA(Asn)/glutamyl-tRNA(Gln) amidotransferase subunit B
MIYYEAKIGLEIHIQINTKSKLFCNCSTQFGNIPNKNICVICTSQPGTIPMLNKKAVEAIVKTGLALKCKINKQSFFSRKQYFYPDSPKNYQITQFNPPLCSDGIIKININNKEKNIHIKRIHLEEDAGKLIHEIGSTKLNYSLLDLNRAGIGLMEFVTEPDFNSSEEVLIFLSKLKNIIEYLETSECNMEEGKMRCDVNISIKKIKDKNLGKKVEIKNINSMSNIKYSIINEIKRQEAILNANKKIIQETRGLKSKNCETKSMRSKENTLDYRYFVEPDLVPFNLKNKFIKKILKQIPELPMLRKKRFMNEYKLSEYDANYLTSKKTIADYYEEVLNFVYNENKSINISKLTANWISTELMSKLNLSNISILKSPITSKNLAKLILLISNSTISGKIAKIIFEEMYISNKSPETIIKEKNIEYISDESTLEKLCENVIIENKNIVQDFMSGKKNALTAIIGCVMKKSKGQANPKIVNEILMKKLKNYIT